MNSAVAEAKVNLSGPNVFSFGTSALDQQKPEKANQYIEPVGEGSHRAAVATELTKLEQIVEYLKVLYR